VNGPRGSRSWCLPIALLLLGATITAAQEAAEPSAPSPPAPQPIAVSEIPRQSEQVSTRLREIESELAPDPRIREIEEALPEWIADARAAKENRRSPESLSLRELDSARSRWLSRKEQLDQWLSVLEARTSDLAARVEELTRLDEVWSATRSHGSGEIPAPLRARINEVRTEIDRVRRATRARLGDVLTLQNQLSEQAGNVQEELDRLGRTLTSARESLLARDAPPIWSALAGAENRPRIFEEALASWRDAQRASQQFVVASSDRLLAQGFLFLVLLWIFWKLRKRAQRFSEQPGLEAPARVLSHPIADALLITLLTTRLFHPHAPLAVYELNRLALLFPLLRILPGLIHASMRFPLYGLAVLYVGDLLTALVPADTFLSRLMQLGVSGVLFTGLVYLARPGGPATRIDLGGWWRAAISGARLGAVITAAALVANVFGRIRLSEALTNAVLSSAYAAVALYAGTVVLQSLLTLLLETRSSQSFRAVSAKREYLRALSTKLVRLAAVVAFVWIVLGSFQLLDPVLAGARNVLTKGISVGEIEVTLGDILAFAITLWLTLQVSRATRVLLDEDVLPRFEFPRGVQGTISVLAHYFILFIGFTIALAAAGIELGRFALLAGAFGVGIGFGLQNVVNNFISGLILLFERPIQVGDTVELGSLLGKVKRIGMRSSTVRTFEGADVIVPNAHLIDSQVVNWTLSDRLRRIEVNVGVAYGTRPREVLDILLGVARAHSEILTDPAPYALFDGFGDSSLNFTLRAWTGNFDEFLRLRSELRVGVHDALEAAGITIPFPQRDLHLKTIPSELKAETSERETAESTRSG
jgi:potassium efflux system protein